MKTTRNSFALVELMIVVAIIGIFAVMLLPRSAEAQPYFTNATAAVGPYQYNDALVPPYQPSVTMSNQVKSGIITGTVITSTDGTATNTFSGIAYTQPPTVVCQQRVYGGAGTPTNVITSVTTTNFVVKSGAPSITNNFTAIGR